MPTYCSNTLQIEALDSRQANRFIENFNFYDYLRFDEQLNDSKIRSTLTFDTPVIPPYQEYHLLYLISQMPWFDGLQFDATYLDEADMFSNIYRWVPERGPSVLATEEGRLLKKSDDSEWPGLNQPASETPTLDHLLDSVAGLFWIRQGRCIEDQLIMDALEKETETQISDYTWEEFRSKSRQLVVRCEQLSELIPPGWDQVSHCKCCGFVWVKESEHVLTCDWCWVREKAQDFPQPRSMDDEKKALVTSRSSHSYVDLPF